MEGLPTIFTNPYPDTNPPTDCCCGVPVQVNIATQPMQITDQYGVITRADQAAAIIAAANRRGFPIFQGQ